MGSRTIINVATSIVINLLVGAGHGMNFASRGEAGRKQLTEELSHALRVN